VTPEALTFLHTLIKQDAHAEDEISKQRLQRHLQKFANAAQTCFAEHVLQREQIHFLKKVNNEAKDRRSTKSLVLGKARVMSYEDLEEARAKRAAKDAAKAKGNGKRGRKRKDRDPEENAPEPKTKRKCGQTGKNSAPKANVQETDALVVGAIEPEATAGRMSVAPEPAKSPVIWMSEAQSGEVLWTSEIQIAPVARMI